MAAAISVGMTTKKAYGTMCLSFVVFWLAQASLAHPKNDKSLHEVKAFLVVGMAGRDPYALNNLFSIIYKNYSTLFTLLFAETVDTVKYKDY